MSAQVFTIESIEGNSHIGVPVFSRSAKKANYEYLVFSPPKGINPKPDPNPLSEPQRIIDNKKKQVIKIVLINFYRSIYCKESKSWRISTNKLRKLRESKHTYKSQKICFLVLNLCLKSTTYLIKHMKARLNKFNE